MNSNLILRLLFALLAIGSLCPNMALAHFPWLMVNSEGKPVLFFGEDLGDRVYKLPKSLLAFPLKQLDSSENVTELRMDSVETESLVGLVSMNSVKTEGCLFGAQTYGNYHGTKLVYFVQHCLGDDPQKWKCPPNNVELQSSIEQHENGIRATIVLNQKPLVDADVKLSSLDGKQSVTAKTDSNGAAVFTGDQLKPGLNAITVGRTDDHASGSLDGVAFSSTSSYLTTTFNWKSDETSAKAATKPDNIVGVRVVSSQFPDLPAELTSFGGAIAGGRLYVYGGHIGEAHSYSTAEQSDSLFSLDLANTKSWEQLPSGPRLQGLAMVAHNESVIRIGGFTAMNAKDEEHDLHSQSSVAMYDPNSRAWKELTSLPEPRSSHAAAATGDLVYVIGGWSMAGDNATQWHQTAWVADLAKQPIVWSPIANPPLTRRALAVAAFDERIYAIGGMDQEGGPTTRVNLYDPKKNSWSEGPSLVGEPMAGFGCWAEPLSGQLYVSTVSGTVQRLSEDRKRWDVVGTYEPGRFFHCMLPLGHQQMVMVGGANMSVGRFTNLDIVKIEPSNPSIVDEK